MLQPTGLCPNSPLLLQSKVSRAETEGGLPGRALSCIDEHNTADDVNLTPRRCRSMSVLIQTEPLSSLSADDRHKPQQRNSNCQSTDNEPGVSQAHRKWSHGLWRALILSVLLGLSLCCGPLYLLYRVVNIRNQEDMHSLQGLNGDLAQIDRLQTSCNRMLWHYKEMVTACDYVRLLSTNNAKNIQTGKQRMERAMAESRMFDSANGMDVNNHVVEQMNTFRHSINLYPTPTCDHIKSFWKERIQQEFHKTSHLNWKSEISHRNVHELMLMLKVNHLQLLDSITKSQSESVSPITIIAHLGLFQSQLNPAPSETSPFVTVWKELIGRLSQVQSELERCTHVLRRQVSDRDMVRLTVCLVCGWLIGALAVTICYLHCRRKQQEHKHNHANLHHLQNTQPVYRYSVQKPSSATVTGGRYSKKSLTKHTAAEKVWQKLATNDTTIRKMSMLTIV